MAGRAATRAAHAILSHTGGYQGSSYHILALVTSPEIFCSAQLLFLIYSQILNTVFVQPLGSNFLEGLNSGHSCTHEIMLTFKAQKLQGPKIACEVNVVNPPPTPEKHMSTLLLVPELHLWLQSGQFVRKLNGNKNRNFMTNFSLH